MGNSELEFLLHSLSGERRPIPHRLQWIIDTPEGSPRAYAHGARLLTDQVGCLCPRMGPSVHTANSRSAGGKYVLTSTCYLGTPRTSSYLSSYNQWAQIGAALPMHWLLVPGPANNSYLHNYRPFLVIDGSTFYVQGRRRLVVHPSVSLLIFMNRLLEGHSASGLEYIMPGCGTPMPPKDKQKFRPPSTGNGL